jgi:integrase
MKKALISAGIKDWYNFSAHNIRKTLETWLVALNQGELKVLAHMGHNKITALRHYIQTDTLPLEEKSQIRDIIGNLYYDKQELDKISLDLKELNDKIGELYAK